MITAKHVRLMEAATGIGRVDADAGVLYDVKIVGLESRNSGRTIGLDPRQFNGALDKPYGYSRQALESAIPMYEGARIRLDHPQSTLDEQGRRVVRQASRGALETIGELRNVRMKEDGLYADAHLLKTHPHTAPIFETAARMPTKLAFSHNADGVPVLKDGRAVIDKILRVNSVDIVGERPGTTNGLFEDAPQETIVKKPIKQIVAATPANTKGRAELLALIEDDYGAMPMDATAAEPEAQLNDALKLLINSIIDDDSLDVAGKLAKVRAVLKLEDQLNGSGEGSGAASGSGSGEADVQESEMSKIENHPTVKQLVETVASITAERDALKAESHARQLLEAAGREVTPIRINAVKALADDAARKQLIEEWPRYLAPGNGKRPERSAPLLESAEYKPAETIEEFARRVKSR